MFINSALSELVTLAAPPGLMQVLAADAAPGGPLVTFDNHAWPTACGPCRRTATDRSWALPSIPSTATTP